MLYSMYIPIIQHNYGGVAMQENNNVTVNRHTKAQAKYDKAHTTGFYMKLNTGTDEDILEWLSRQESKQGAIKKLIRAEIAKTH